MRRLKILVLAYACEPNRGSEPAVGWNGALGLAERHQVVVLTRENNREVIEAFVAANDCPPIEFRYYDLPGWVIRLKKRVNGAELYYVIWQFGVRRFMRRVLEEAGPFDLVHHLTFASFRYPTALSAVKALPVVWGPVGGADMAPTALLSGGCGFYGVCREILRNVATVLSRRLVRFTAPSARGARIAVLVSTPETARVLSAAGFGTCPAVPAITLSRRMLEGFGRCAAIEPVPGLLRILFVGRLVALKGVHLGLRAVAGLRPGSYSLTIVGDGPERERLVALAKRLGVEDQVRFVGAIPQSELQPHYAAADVLLAPSLYESGGLTVLEAQACGRPAVALAVGGHAVSIRGACGQAVAPTGGAAAVIGRLRRALEIYQNDPELLLAHGEAARRNVVAHYSRDGKIDEFERIYARLIPAAAAAGAPRRLKVLLSAYACEPARGSEPGVGWEWATRMARLHDVYVLTRANNRPVIEATLGKLWQEGQPRMLYFDLACWLVELKKLRVCPVFIYYILWQWSAPRAARRLVSGVELIHHVTFNGFRFPGAWWHEAVPVVLGPLGGTSVVATHYRRCFGSCRTTEMVRTLSIRWWRWNLWTRKSLHSASEIMVVQEVMAKELAEVGLAATVMLETALPEGLEAEPETASAGERRDFVWVGGIEPWKGWQLALEAFALAVRAGLEQKLLIIGKGADYAKALRLVSALGIVGSVEFIGGMAREDVYRAMGRARGLIFSSVRDTSGNVVLEAMGLRCPVVCLRHQGVELMTDDKCAIRIPPAEWQETVRAFAQAIQALASDDHKVAEMGNAGRARALEAFTWDAKIRQTSEIYARAAAAHTARAQAS